MNNNSKPSCSQAECHIYFKTWVIGTGISPVYNIQEGLEEFLEAIYYCCCLLSSVLMGKSLVSSGMQMVPAW